MPIKLRHNVFMSQTAAVASEASPAFAFNWRDIERGIPLSMLEEFSGYSGIAV